MANPLYNEFGPTPSSMANGQADFINRLNTLKQSVSDPNAMIQQMLNSGRITHEQYNSAVMQAQQIQQMLNHQNGR